MLHCGIVGLPLSGKSTIFNVITRAGAEVKPYSGGKTDPNRAVVDVPDARFDRLVGVHSPRKRTPAQVEFVDLAGLSRGAGKGAGLGNAFLSFVSDADALLHVVRCFENGAVEHPEGSVDPLRDIGILETELIFRDLAVVENRLGKLSAKKKLLPEESVEKALLGRCLDCLMDEKPIRSLAMTPEEGRALRGFTFVTAKPQIVVLNLDETQKEVAVLPNGEALECAIKARGLSVIKAYGRFEMDLLELSPEEAAEFADGLQIDEPARGRLISEAYRTLGLISFFTCGPDEVRAWTLHDGDSALDAAGAIHTDLARGFIRAQVVSYDDYTSHSDSYASCRDSGVLRLEGKEYRVKDGDIIEIRFNI
ncbi:MAG: redox-regulated ATPase YchF [Synergistaceae bacterium]|jgi:GTP-binding protein YchF|nr:redox-regulated ATPase YchF [Synergistaceae bacterium]